MNYQPVCALNIKIVGPLLDLQLSYLALLDICGYYVELHAV